MKGSLCLSVGSGDLDPPPRPPRAIQARHSREMIVTTFGRLGAPCRRRSAITRSPSPAASRTALRAVVAPTPARASSATMRKAASWPIVNPAARAGGGDRCRRAGAAASARPYDRAIRNGASGQGTWRRPPAAQRALAPPPYPSAGSAGAPPRSGTQCARRRLRQSRRRHRPAKGRGRSRRQTPTFGRYRAPRRILFQT